MRHLAYTQVFFIGALGDDRNILITALLSEVGHEIVYVKDFGDFIAHRIEVTAVHRTTDEMPMPTEMAASAWLLAGQNAGLPEDVGSIYNYVGKVNLVTGITTDIDDKTHGAELNNARVLNPFRPKFWAKINEGRGKGHRAGREKGKEADDV